MRNITLLKLGGSLITDKSKPFTAKLAIIDDLARQIKEALEEDTQLKLIIGNGSGSFAHYPAVQYKMSDGIGNEKQKMGFCLVQDAASKLNRIVVAAFLKVGVRAISLNPSSMIVSSHGVIRNFFIDPLIGLLPLGIVPVLYGDIVIDEIDGSHIYSTEELLGEVGRKLLKRGDSIERIIHNGVTPGVLDIKGELITSIKKEEFATLKQIFYKTDGYDVTGGMLHKVEEAIKLADRGIHTLIINGTAQKDLLKKALLGMKVKGTLIR